MALRRAMPSEHKTLSRLAYQSKAHWGYSRSYLASYKTVLTLDPEYIACNQVYCFWHKEELVGFFAFLKKENETLLDYFFIYPKFINQSFGRKMWKEAIRIAERENYKNFLIISDPHALGFYLNFGASIIGTRQSEASSKIQLPVLEFSLTVKKLRIA